MPYCLLSPLHLLYVTSFLKLDPIFILIFSMPYFYQLETRREKEIKIVKLTFRSHKKNHQKNKVRETILIKWKVSLFRKLNFL
jgi:hypothetical protein